jgi:hypothetical protein
MANELTNRGSIERACSWAARKRRTTLSDPELARLRADHEAALLYIADLNNALQGVLSASAIGLYAES